MDSKQRFKYPMEKHNLSMSEYGRRIGLSTSGVSAIIYGTRQMNEKHIKLICAAFPDINEEWLRSDIGDADVKVNAEDIENYMKEKGLPEIDRTIIEGLQELTPDQKEAVLKIIQDLASKDKK